MAYGGGLFVLDLLFNGKSTRSLRNTSSSTAFELIMEPSKMAAASGEAKKRKAAQDGNEREEGRSFVWLLTLAHTSGYDCLESERKVAALSSRERAVAAMPKFMDDRCGVGWRNGLKGFGRWKKENWAGSYRSRFEYFGDELDGDGDLISNENDTDCPDNIVVSLKCVEVDPPDAGNEARAVGEDEAPNPHRHGIEVAPGLLLLLVDVYFARNDAPPTIPSACRGVSLLNLRRKGAIAAARNKCHPGDTAWSKSRGPMSSRAIIIR